MRFVVADDMHTPRAILQRILLEAGHEVRAAGGGVEALKLVQADPPDAVILDVSMPDCGGDVTARKIRALYPDITIFMASNISNANIRGSLERELGAHFVTKPFRSAQLLAVLNKVFGT